MSAKHWKLVITPLSAGALAGRPPREVTVSADNWLSALRAARKTLGEEGGVPPGASVVMSSSGEVTILDSAQRLRYVLARSEEPARTPAPVPPAPARVSPLPARAGAAGRKRAVTVAYLPDEAAAARNSAPANRSSSGTSEPPRASPPISFAPSRPSSRPTGPTPSLPATPIEPAPPPSAAGKRPATMAYTAEGSGAHQLAAQAPVSAPLPPEAGARPRRKQTMAYSAEESAEARAQMAAAVPPQARTNAATLRADDLPNVQSMLVTLGYRDEEQGPGSQLTYRERSFYWPPPVARSDVERSLRGELGNMRRNLEGRPRGQYVNLAVFDHAFRDRPERPPVATLQWKDWRGEPEFSWAGESQASQWAPAPAEQPVRTSFTPQAHEGAPGRVTSSQSLPPAAPPAPAAPAAAWPPPPAAPAFAPEPQPVPHSALFTPEPTRPGHRDSTGDQDKRLAIAFEATQDLYFLTTPVDGLDFGVKLLHELVPSEAISGCIYDINTDEFRFVAVTGTGAAERRAAAVRSSAGLFAAAVRSGRDDLIVSDVASEPRYEPECDGRTGLVARNMVFLPLHKANQLFGMLQLINRQGPRGFTESDVAVANYVANQLTEFLRSKRGLGRR